MADGSVRDIPIGLPRAFRVADLFCGAGGMSTGAARAIRDLGRDMQLVGVNHWPVAIETNKRNHPEHAGRIHCADLEAVRPIEKVPEGALDLLMAAPSCVFHSRARGGRPVNDQQRMDPWHVVRWCTELRVKRLLVENVPEFVDWGPCSLVTGRPIPSRKGEYFRAWLDALKAIGFRVEYRVLCAADFGDPTTRRRFFLIGASDRRRLRWPEPTHAERGGTDLFGSRNRWRAAAEIIDWSIEGGSIFTRKKPLAPNTLRRIHAGAVRYRWPQPYIDALQALLDGREPVLDVPAADVDPMLIHLRGASDHAIANTTRTVEAPLPPLTAGGGHVGLVMATGAGGVARDTAKPIPTVTAGGDGGARPPFVAPLLMGVHGHAVAKPTDEPAPTITTGGGSSEKRPGNARPQLIEPFVFRANQGTGRNGSQRAVSQPLVTTTCQESLALVAPYYGGGSGLTAGPASDPVPAVTTKARFGLAEPVMIQTDQTGSAGWVRVTSSPVGTVVSKQNTGLAEPFLVPAYGERDGQAPRTHTIDSPVPVITTANRFGVAEPAFEGVRIDIRYRMLHWRELARAMSFDDEGEVYDFAGNATEITKQIGNAVPGRLAKALVRALLEDLP